MKTTEILLIIITISWVVLVFKISTTMNTHPHSPLSSTEPSITSTSATAIAPTSDYELAKSQSFHFFDDISTSQWKRLQQIFIEHENHKHPEKPFVFHPEASEHQSIPEVYKYRRGHAGWSSYAAWYQSVRFLGG